jgi:hypothetical protein
MSSVAINPPKTPVTAGSNGVAAATLPNVCKMPGPPAPFVPTPLPNIGKSGNSPQGYSKDVTIEGHAVAIQGATFKSMGDVASQGTGGGLISSNVEGPTSFVGPGSLDVKIEGKNVQLLSDPMLNNGGPSGTPANAGTMMGIIQMSGLVLAVDEACPICEKNHGKLEETPQTKVDAAGLAAEFEAELSKVDGNTSTMLGVVKCQCGTNYADQSGVTTIELCAAANECGMKHATEVTNSVANRSGDKARRRTSILEVRRRMELLLGEGPALADAWAEGEARAAASMRNSARGAAYPPGACAAQKAILLLREDGALPGAMTEQWYSRSREGTKSPIAVVDMRERSPDPIPLYFPHGATVPPCGTCEIVLPVLLCPGDKIQCSHKS